MTLLKSMENLSKSNGIDTQQIRMAYQKESPFIRLKIKTQIIGLFKIGLIFC